MVSFVPDSLGVKLFHPLGGKSISYILSSSLLIYSIFLNLKFYVHLIGGFVRSVVASIKQNRQINEEETPENQETEADYQPGIGSDLKPMNGGPIPAEGIHEEDLKNS